MKDQISVQSADRMLVPKMKNSKSVREGLKNYINYFCGIFLEWGVGTLGSGTLVCDTSTQIGHFRAKWTKLFNLIAKGIIVTPKTFQRFIFCI